VAEIGKDIAKAKTLLEEGKLVAIPTETVYGLAANALDVQAVTKIFKVKDRPYFDPLIVHVSDAGAIINYSVQVPAKAKLLIDLFWPGPLTVLLEKKGKIPDLVTSGLDRVGLRCPNHPLTRQLLKSLAFPLAAPSANPFGYISPTRPEHVNDQLGNKIEYILDGGECNVGIESTIIGFDNDQVIIYRVGGLSVEAIESVAGKVIINAPSAAHLNLPGQLLSHYAPRKPLVVGSIDKLLEKHFSNSIGVLTFQKKYHAEVIKKQIVLSTSGNLEEAAQKLFSAMREMDQSGVDLILAEEVPNVGLGRAINDRLRRASHK
jgi:L-threonylcarbamoyladenylate synthase